MLEDGTYDAMVFDVDDSQDGVTTVSFTIVSGPHRGEVIALRSAATEGDPIELLGIPATITVVDGAPKVRFEP